MKHTTLYKKGEAILIASLLFLSHTVIAQNVTVTATLSSNKDSIYISVLKDFAIKNGTLKLNVASIDSNENLYYPILLTSAQFALVVPPNCKWLHLTGFFYPQLFNVKGRIENKKKNKKLIYGITTVNNASYVGNVIPMPNDSLTIPELVFDNDATLAFMFSPRSNNGYPKIAIQQTPKPGDFTDKVFEQNIVIDNTAPLHDTSVFNIEPPKPVVKKNDEFNKKAKTLDSVVVKIKTKKITETFLEENASPLFSDPNEKNIDCLSNDDILSYPDVLRFLQSKLPSFHVQMDTNGESKAIWRGEETKSFYIDEMPVDADQVLALNVADIAVIKAIPQAMLLGRGSGGTIAVYTRTGDYRRPGREELKWIFTIKGYTPSIYHTLEPK